MVLLRAWFGGVFVKLALTFLAIFVVTAATAAAEPLPSDVLAQVPAWFEPTADANQSFIARSNGGIVKVGPRSMAFRANGKADHMEWVGANDARLAGAGFDGAVTDYHVGAAS